MYGFRSAVRILRWAAVAGVVAVVGVLPAGPALAGGPTSVLLVAPSTGATASLYTDDKAYGLLERALGTDPAPEDGAPAGDMRPSHDGVTITWLIHDVEVWRTDHVAITADGNPWILTRISYGGAIAPDDPGVWHHAAEPKLLLSLLGRLRVLEGRGTSGGGAVGVSASATTPAATTSAPTEPDGVKFWGWLLPGLLAGILIGVGGRTAADLAVRVRQRARLSGSQQQLIDR